MLEALGWQDVKASKVAALAAGLKRVTRLRKAFGDGTAQRS